MHQLIQQLLSIIREITLFHKALLCAALIVAGGSLYYLSAPGSSALTALYPLERISEAESTQIRSYLTEKQIPFEEKKKGKFFVPKEELSVLQKDLSLAGLFKKREKSGFELFDSATWLKGEKELQVLEIRALKEQLEKDLTAFEKITAAHVILDIPPQRNFGNAQLKPKASVILTLTPESYLAHAEIQAVVHHLTGAVRSLEPQMIAISDTKGRLYQIIDPSAPPFSQIPLQSMVHEEIYQKIEKFLLKIYGDKNFFLDVQLKWKEKELLDSLSVFLFLNREENFVFEELHLSALIETLLQSYKVEPLIKIETIAFANKTSEKKVVVPPKVVLKPMKRAFYAFLGLLTLFLFYLWKKSHSKKKVRSNSTAQALEHNLQAVMGKINLETLVSLIKEQPPETIALMLSYLESSRKELLLALLPPLVREEVLKHGT